MIEWDKLPEQARPIASMLATGFKQREIARALGLSDDTVAKRVRELRDAIVDQAVERIDELAAPLQERVNRIRGDRRTD